jgi:hypothetical protein
MQSINDIHDVGHANLVRAAVRHWDGVADLRKDYVPDLAASGVAEANIRIQTYHL